jgi:hypothetical protein
MSKITEISKQKLKKAVISLVERAEHLRESESFSALFADSDQLMKITPLKNQVIFGRRGTGKTHLMGRLYEWYREEYHAERNLALFIDGRTISHRPETSGTDPVISILISYRRFLHEVVDALEKHMKDKMIKGFIDKHFPTQKAVKIQTINTALRSITRAITFGSIEFLPGKTEKTKERKVAVSQASYDKVAAQFEAKLLEVPSMKVDIASSYSDRVSRTTDDKIKIAYEGLSVLDFQAIRQGLDVVLKELEANCLVLLFDEWSALDTEYQPIFADMIRSTLGGGNRVRIKFACIPSLTRLSAVKNDGQTIGFPIGEEVFMDVDLDRVSSPYRNQESVTVFLLKVLKKHLAVSLEEFKEASLAEILDGLFEAPNAMAEMVFGSAGVPRDFLRIFAKAFDEAGDNPRIQLKNVRIAIHDIFQSEKQQLLQTHASAYSVFSDLYSKICAGSKSYCFFVSQKNSGNKNLRDLWNNRVIHLIYKGHSAFAGDTPGVYDIYVIDYGQWVTLRSNQKGEEVFQVAQNAFRGILSLISVITSQDQSSSTLSGIDAQLRETLKKAAAATLDTTPMNLDEAIEDCSRIVADSVLT